MKIRLNQDDGKVANILAWLNRIGAFSCWLAIFADISYFAATTDLGLTLVFGMYTPLRYFLFDMAPEKLQKRPASLDRSITLTIFVRYLRIRFPIPQGNFLASLTGFFLACARAMINGYALLFFDTFTFLYQVKNDRHGVPLDTDIAILHDNDKLEELEEKADNASSEEKAARLHKLYEEWQQTKITNSISIWDFPVRRYLNKPNYYFDNKEIGNKLLDDKYDLDIKKFKAAQEMKKK